MGSGDSPRDGENLSDSNSEKRRSRKQKPRKMISHYEDEDMGEESDERSPRDRHMSSSSFGQSQPDDHLMQQEPEDLSFRPPSQNERRIELEHHVEIYRQSLKDDNIQHGGVRNRSEGSDGSLSVSDDGPASLHSTPKDKYQGGEDLDLDDKDGDGDDDDRGVSPPTGHGGAFSGGLFGSTHGVHHQGMLPIRLGLSGAALPISRDYMEKEKEILAMVAKQQQEISQQ